MKDVLFKNVINRLIFISIYILLWCVASNTYLQYTFDYWHLEIVLLQWLEIIFIDKQYHHLLSIEFVIISLTLLIGCMIAVSISPTAQNKIHGNASFASWRQIKKMQLASQRKRGFVMGIYTDKVEKYFSTNNKLMKYFYRNHLSRVIKNRLIVNNEPLSMLLIAPPGTGKTAGIVIPNMFHCYNSIIVLDVKGEIYSHTNAFRRTIGKVDCFNPANPESMKYNPLDKNNLPNTLSAKLQAVNKLVNTLIKQDSGGSKNDYFKKAASDLLNCLISFVVVIDHYKDAAQVQNAIHEPEQADKKILNVHASIPYVVNTLLSDLQDIAKAIIAGEEECNVNRQQQFMMIELQLELLHSLLALSEKEQHNLSIITDNIKNKAKEYGAMANDQYSGVIGSINADCNVFRSDPIVIANTSSNDINFADYFAKLHTLYIVIKAEDIDRLKDLLSLFFESFSMFALSRKPKKEDHRVTVILDEFPRLPKMSQVANMPALSRGQGVNLLLVAQSIGQLKETYGVDGSQTFFDTCAYQIILPQCDTDSASKMSKKLGNKTVTSTQISTSSRGSQNSTSISSTGKELLTANQIMNMKMGSALVTAQFFGSTPIKCNLPFWFLSYDMIKKSNINYDA